MTAAQQLPSHMRVSVVAMKLLPLVILATATSVACAAPSTEPDSETSDSALTREQVILEFRADGSQQHDGAALTTDREIIVAYDTPRLSGCGLLQQGVVSPLEIDLSYRVHGGAIHTVPLGTDWFGPAGSTTARAVLPNLAASDVGTLELWFHATNGTCQAWDSAGGHNFTFDVHDTRTGKIAFDAVRDHAPTPGVLPSGGLIDVAYDGTRVPGCQVSIEEGQHIVVMHYRFDGLGNWQHKSRNTVFSGSDFGLVEIPIGAHSFEMWFEATDGGHCHDYDSMHAHNYVFALK